MLGASPFVCRAVNDGQVAQLVEQRTENPCVGGSIPPLATRRPFGRKTCPCLEHLIDFINN